MRRLAELVTRAPGIGAGARWLRRWVTMPAQLRLVQSNARAVALEIARLHQRDAAGIGALAPGATPPAPRRLALPSRMCTQAQFLSPEFAYWRGRLKQDLFWHRKQWEFCFIAQALWERDMLQAGRRGCGFGVGMEPLPALFASFGCRVTASDAPADAVGAGWRETGQYAGALEPLNAAGIAAPETFAANVDWRAVDMNALPPDLTGFDFVWSACAMEHLGSIDRAIAFLVNSCRCLKPGGVAVHTTEFNVSSDDATLVRGPTVLLRRQDVLRARERLREVDCEMAPVDFDAGDGVLDHFVAVPPYAYSAADAPMLKVAVRGFVATSLGLIVEKRRG
jgi:SAM-dependent methyltransferase